MPETRAQKNAARKLARARMAQERVRLKHWVPEERARAAKAKAMAREGLKVELARIDAKLQADIAAARARAKKRPGDNPVKRSSGPTKRRKRRVSASSGSGFAARMARARAAAKRKRARAR